MAAIVEAGEVQAAAEGAPASARERGPISFRRLPAAVWVVALLAACFHVLAFARAELTTPPGWRFTGMLSANPDEVQYRVWAHRSQVVGPIVDNTLTSEDNRPYLPVFLFWGVGKVAGALHVAPGKVYDYAGAPLAFLLALLLFGLARHFTRTRAQAWWVYLAMLLGGGVGAHIQWLRALLHLPPLRGGGTAQLSAGGAPLAGQAPDAWMFLESYRGDFVVKALLDTHMLFVWLLALAALVAYYNALVRFTRARATLAAAGFALLTLAHVYEGVTLTAIAAAVLVCYAAQRLPLRRPALLLVATSAAVGACYLGLALLLRRSGLPFPSWHAMNILPSLLFLAFPLAWLLLAWKGPAYWRSGGGDAAFLFGWVLGCTVVTLSGPFFPYPDRGTMTLQVGLFLLAGAAYFAFRPTVGRVGAVLVVLLLGVFPLRLLLGWWQAGRFEDWKTWAFLDAPHRSIVAAEQRLARPGDVLLADFNDVLWLAPDYPGRVYVGHFFLTVDYQRKYEALVRFLAQPQAERAFLRTSGARFLFVSAQHDPRRFQALSELTPVARAAPGWLFRIAPPAAGAASAPPPTQPSR